MRLDAMPSEVVQERPIIAAPEPTTVVFARVPWSLGEKLRDLARERSRTERRRVTLNELLIEALNHLAK